jgi:hypothetical protein
VYNKQLAEVRVTPLCCIILEGKPDGTSSSSDMTCVVLSLAVTIKGEAD